MEWIMPSDSANISIPKAYPLAILVSTYFLVQQKRVHKECLDKQAKILGKPCFGKYFDAEHKLAFGDDTESVHLSDGLPQHFDYGWYSQKLSYKEWHMLASARSAHEELAADCPRNAY